MSTPSSVRASILLVDDYEDSRDMYAELLLLSGYRVVTANDGQEALERASREPFDVIIMDVALPRLDGISATRVLRSRRETKDVPIVMLSAMVGSEVRKTALEAGADEFLEKPCLPEQVEIVLRRLLASKRKC